MKFEIFKDRFNYWFWRFVDYDNEIIANSSKGFASLKECKSSIKLIKFFAFGADIIKVKLE